MRKPLRLLYFHQHFSTPKGSTGTRSYEFARRLVARGHRVTMVCGSYKVGHTGLTPRGDERVLRGQVDGIDVVEFRLPYQNSDGFLKRAWTFVRFAAFCVGVALRESYDLIYATSTPLTVGIPALAARFLRGKAYIFEVRDLWPELPREMGVIKNPLILGAMGVLEWCAYRAARATVALSPGIARGILRTGVDPKRVELIPNGCDLEAFGVERRHAKVSVLGIAPENFVALFSGAHGQANGLDAVLDAAAVLKRRGRPDIKFLFLGDGKCKPALVARAQREQLTNCVFADPVPKTKLVEIMASVDVGLQVLADVPAFYDGTSPNKFFDYIAAGLPVLNNYPGWLAKLIRESGCGVVVPPRDPAAFADALVALAERRAELPAMSEAGRSLAREHFDRSVLAERFIRLVESLA